MALHNPDPLASLFFDPSQGSFLFDDFITTHPGAAVAEFASPNFILSAAGAGASVGSVAGELGSPGIITLNTGTTAAGRAALVNKTGVASGPVKFGNGVIVYKVRFRIPILSDGVQSFGIELGLCDGLNTASTDGFFFAVTNGNDPRPTKANAGAVIFNSLFTTMGQWQQNVWHTLTITINESGTDCSYKIYRESDQQTFETAGPNVFGAIFLPTIPLHIAVKTIKTAGLLNRSVDIDYTLYSQQFSTTRP